jgi:hypothetical protein
LEIPVPNLVATLHFLNRLRQKAITFSQEDFS